MVLQGRREPVHGGLRAASLLRDTLQNHHQVRSRSFGSRELIPLLPVFLILVPESTLPKNDTVILESAQRLSGISKRMGCKRAKVTGGANHLEIPDNAWGVSGMTFSLLRVCGVSPRK